MKNSKPLAWSFFSYIRLAASDIGFASDIRFASVIGFASFRANIISLLRSRNITAKQYHSGEVGISPKATESALWLFLLLSAPFATIKQKGE
ncbi:MAG: hypothetical protein J6I89_04690 [Oscillospiraceae bacterium]|nr:hypothetical protein [Oscillospiraceae bacterium]